MKRTKKDGFGKRNRLFDVLFMVILIAIYSIVSFINLGDWNSPQTFYRFGTGETVNFILPEKTEVSSMMIYVGTCNNDFSLSYRYSRKDADKSSDFSDEDFYAFQSTGISGPFRWERIGLGKTARVFSIKNTSGRTIYLGEVAFIKDGTPIGGVDARKIVAYQSENDDANVLTDEQSLVPEQSNFMNSSYFDELYFAQTAYQYANGQYGYENVHPPLGKILQSIPITLTGHMSPLTWRLAGNIAGILIILVVYFLAEEVFGSKSYARLAAVLVSLCGLHFVQTRVGTIDSHLCLFTALSFLFMLKFIHKDKWRYFVLSGLFFGCAASVKWSGFFGGIGLAIMFFYHIYNTRFKLKKKKESAFAILMGALCFVLVPAVIYFGSYLLFPATTNAKSFNDVIAQGNHLYTFHATLQDNHPSASPWFSWPVSGKPFLYYLNDGKVIKLFGNYVICYTSLLGLALTAYYAIRKKDKKSCFMLVAFLSLLLPYMFISRTMYLYHYLPASIFAILMLVNVFRLVPETRRYIYYFLVAVLVCFIVSYPAMTGV